MQPNKHTALELGQIIQALAFAAHKHRDQRRKDNEASPYINHPIALSNVLVNEAGITDPVTVCAALLHDTIEDTETSAEELLEAFGPDVLSVVLEVTDDKSLPKAERKRLQIEHAAHASDRAKLVKLADKICNLRDIENSPPADWSDQRKQDYYDWAKAVVDQLRGVNPRLENLFDEAYGEAPARTPPAPATKTWARLTHENLQAAIEQFKKDNAGKTWEDLAREQEAHLGKPSV